MVNFLKPNKAVILLQGRYVGRKGFIVKAFDDDMRDRAYGHCLIVGIKKYLSKVIRKDSTKKITTKSRVKPFIKLVNYQHMMPTRYNLDLDLKEVVTLDLLSSKDKKVTTLKETKKRFEERFKSGKNKWFFTKLRFLAEQTFGNGYGFSFQFDFGIYCFGIEPQWKTIIMMGF